MLLRRFIMARGKLQNKFWLAAIVKHISFVLMRMGIDLGEAKQ
jgi:hypothetical protein